MELKLKLRNNIFFYLAFLWISLIFLLGSWWLILIKKLGEHIPVTNTNLPNLAKLTFWEGGAFFIFLIFLSILIIYFYTRDLKKQKSLQTFFATMTHELKTPLASIHLQAEVLEEEAQIIKNDRIQILSQRLLEESWQLENHIDKILQLARVERNAQLHLEDTLLKDIKKNIEAISPDTLITSIQGDYDIKVQSDQFALNIVFRNLFENTLKHIDKNEKRNVDISITKEQNHIIFKYSDHNEFKGTIDKLGQLFYKFDSPKGSGIGLYLCKSLIKSMGGELLISQIENKLIFTIRLLKK